MNTEKVLKDALVGCTNEESSRAIGMNWGAPNNQVAGEFLCFLKVKTPNFLNCFYNFIDAACTVAGRITMLGKLAGEFGFMLIAKPSIIIIAFPAETWIAAMLKELSAVTDECEAALSDGRSEPDPREMGKHKVSEQRICGRLRGWPIQP